jgi:hypothetical protein
LLSARVTVIAGLDHIIEHTAAIGIAVGLRADISIVTIQRLAFAGTLLAGVGFGTKVPIIAGGAIVFVFTVARFEVAVLGGAWVTVVAAFLRSAHA